MKPANAHRHFAHLISNGNDPFADAKRHADLVLNVLGGNRGGRENDDYSGALTECLFDRLVPSSSGRNIVLIEERIETGVVEVVIEPLGELAVGARIADEYLLMQAGTLSDAIKTSGSNESCPAMLSHTDCRQPAWMTCAWYKTFQWPASPIVTVAAF